MTQNALPESWETSKWLVISTHLEDAVFSCGRLLSAHPGTVVATVMAGIPDAGVKASPRDTKAGFASAREAVQARREEDREALAMLGASPVWLNFLDDQYDHTNTPERIAPAIVELLDAYPERRVLVPFGLFHRDHLLVSAAVWQVMQACTNELAGFDSGASPLDRWCFYEDMPYRRLSGLAATRIAAWREQGYSVRRVEPVPPDDACAAAKVEALQAYESQLALLEPEALIDLNTSESYWQLQWSPVPGLNHTRLARQLDCGESPSFSAVSARRL